LAGRGEKRAESALDEGRIKIVPISGLRLRTPPVKIYRFDLLDHDEQ
jgi:hypothetical protein